MLKIEISDRAEKDLSSIQTYISKTDGKSAERTIYRIKRAIDNLALIPELGRPWHDGPSRALSLAGIPYRVHYQIHNDHIEIITIWHTSRMPPGI